jgi:hypothetical protein
MQRGREKGVGSKEWGVGRRKFLSHPHSLLPTLYSLLDYEIKLVVLKPRPKADKPVQPNEYKAALIITKK